jgi:hypothetical protein
MEKKEYLIPEVRICEARIERSVLSTFPADGENANPWEEDW